jgi:hypothetical protein
MTHFSIGESGKLTVYHRLLACFLIELQGTFLVKTNIMLSQTEITKLQSQSSTLMNTLTERIDKAVQSGYTENMNVNRQGLYVEAGNKIYLPDEVSIVDFYRFEGESDPADGAILYLIETNDGLKGTLVDAYGTYADGYINKFITEVEEITKAERASNRDEA